jgi:hypothetical protein
MRSMAVMPLMVWLPRVRVSREHCQRRHLANSARNKAIAAASRCEWHGASSWCRAVSSGSSKATCEGTGRAEMRARCNHMAMDADAQAGGVHRTTRPRCLTGFVSRGI